MRLGLRFLVSASLAFPCAYGQSEAGTITGVVKDPAGAVVPKVNVTCRSAATNSIRQAYTGQDGIYRITNLEPGEYVIEVETVGFRHARTLPALLKTADVLRLDVPLEVGDVTDSVTVTAAADDVNTDDVQLGKTFRDLSNVPLLSGSSGRNVLLLVGLQPGVAYDNAGHFSVNGQRIGSNSFTLDGADSTNIADSQADSVDLLSPNAVAEVRLVTGVIKAEYGRNSGGVAMVTTKSGGNTFHGGASEIFRNRALNAVPFFNQGAPGGTEQRFSDGTLRKPQWNGNDFDMYLGGPVKPNRTFFFVSYLGFRRRQGDSRTATVPTDDQRAAIETYGVPEAKALLAVMPRAQSNDVYVSVPSNALNHDGAFGKIDQQLSARDHLSAFYFADDHHAVVPFTTAGVNQRTGIPGFGIDNGMRRQNISLRESHTLSSSFNEFQLAYHRNANHSDPLTKISLSGLGLTGIRPDDPAGETVPSVTISNLTVFGSATTVPAALERNSWQLRDNLSWIRRRHALKIGVEYLAHVVHTTFGNNNSGRIVIDGSGTSLGSPLVNRVIPGLPQALNDFANGYALQFIQGNSLRAAGHTRSFEVFGQDDWKIGRNFMVNLGLRWEYNSPITDQRDRFLTLQPGRQSVVFPDAPVGLLYPGDEGVSRSTYHRDWNNFSPRLGMAWDVLGNGKLAIRGGYGLLYDSPDYQLGAPFITAPPFNITATITSTRYADPWASSLVNPIPQPFPFHPAGPGDRLNFKALAPLTLGYYDPALATPYTQEWSFQVQHQVSPNWVIEAAYVGSSAVKLLSQHQVNPAVLTPMATTINENSRRRLNLGNPQSGQYGGAVFGSIVSEGTDANSSYHSLQISVTHKFAHGLQLSNAYTWGHAIDNASSIDWSGAGMTTRIDDYRADRGNSSFDVRHRYILTYQYELPRFENTHAWAHRVLGGWGISGISTFQTGLPFDVIDTTDRCLCGSGGQRPDYIGGQVQFLDPRSTSSHFWFDGTILTQGTGAPNPFFRRVGSGPSAAQGAGRFGNFGRNVFHGPGVNNWDVAVLRQWRLRDTGHFDFRAELVNIFNHAQFLNPNANIQQNTMFGRITATRDARIVQLTLRYGF